MSARRVASTLACLLLFAGAAAGQARPPSPPPSDERIANAEAWLKAAAAHVPGEEDQPLVDAASWSSRRVQSLWIELTVITRLMRNPRLGAVTFQLPGQKPIPVNYTTPQMHRLRVLACAASGRLLDRLCLELHAAQEIDPELDRLAAAAGAARLSGDVNYVLRRGALLHADVVMSKPESLEPVDGSSPAAPSPLAGPQRFSVNMSDGRETDFGRGAIHWEIARMLLDNVRPGETLPPLPARDPMVLAWYRATAGWMQDQERHERTHLDRARELFPNDPDILFLSGCQRETFASPGVQSLLQQVVLPTGITLDVQSDRVELREAEAFFRRAIAVKPDFAEARLRLGHVLLARGQPDDAAAELQRAIDQVDEPLLEYYAALLLGAADERLGRLDDARALYARAAERYPEAQAPHMALSQLARRRGDRAGALAELQRVFELPDRYQRDDPWWTYYIAAARSADRWLEDLRRPFLAEARP